MNICTMNGRIVHDLELKTSGDKTFITFTIANDTGYKDHKKTNFIKCVAFGKTAETIGKFFSKGSPILISGELTQNTYEDKTGAKRDSYEIIVKEFSFMGEKKSNEYVAPEMPADKPTASGSMEFPYDVDAPF